MKMKREGSKRNTNWSWEDFHQIKTIHSFWEMKCTFHQSPKSNGFDPTKVKSTLTKVQTESQTSQDHKNGST